MSAARSDATLVIPRSAVQQAGERTIVFVADTAAPGSYTARDVRLGPIAGDVVAVLSGVAEGELVVTDGAFAVKAEWQRTGGRLPDTPATAERVALQVTEEGFVPATTTVTAGRAIELVVTRTTENTCATEIVIGGQRAKLPLNRPVTLTLPPLAKGELKFTCGMAMLKGTIVAR